VKNILKACVAAMTSLAAFAVPSWLAAQDQRQQNSTLRGYVVTDLGPTQSFAEGINNRGLVVGTMFLADGVTQHAFSWQEGIQTDLGTFGGPNSSAFFKPSEHGQAAGNAETSTPDPLGEDFCAYGTHLVCRGFVWQKGVMTPLPTLGGNNNWATGGVNNRGQVGGTAENTTLDPTCADSAHEARPVIWEKTDVRELPLLPGAPDGSVSEINDRGQAVGVTTDCTAAPTIFHAVLWRDGTITDLGGFGGALNNSANGINSRGQVVGVSDLPGDTSFRAFFWENGVMTDLGTLYGLPSGWAFGINDEGQVVGMVCNAGFDCGAFLWQDGVMTDLNMLLPNNTPWNLIVATNINNRGEIVATAENNGFHTVLLTPCDERHANSEGCKDADAGAAAAQRDISERPNSTLSEHARKLLWQHMGGRYRIPPPAGMMTEIGSDSALLQSPSCSAQNSSRQSRAAATSANPDSTIGPLVYGYCRLNGQLLSGYCIGSNPFDQRVCSSGKDAVQCPAGAKAIRPERVTFGRLCEAIEVDAARRCAFRLQ
jgi:probable HAF family extracellular repeat protein